MESVLPVTSFMAASLGILMFLLTWLVSMRRAVLGKQAGDIGKFVFGDGDDETLRRRIRAFGNFVEYSPYALVMVALIELQHAPNSLLWSLAAAFVIGRIVHAIAMLYNPRFPLPRALAMFTTYGCLLIPGAWMLLNTV
ncbi:hypothetical protein P886_0460 [Alteromonadaceae bacterium 2753L.S.0a.02]|nr:hypothetical protein P886_0460 [Alteromonadaceae bacterium 2753L.S.0a.02]